ncbi:bis(5'-nucleosyl)-tetraphosphatase PrpE [Bhargavaea ullalensis]|uniref:Protein phosphatase n=1 Tax=Bhargavaea ullalensis TaxID=1265685 RepID=A0ABV2GBL2_9BACL
MKVDIFGDVHGCFDEFMELFGKLGYRMENGRPAHPDGRKPAFVGDVTDRGPKSVEMMKFLFTLQDAGELIYSPGNHCNKLYRYMLGNNVQLKHGLETTVAELDGLPGKEREHIRRRFIRLYESLPLYRQLDGGKLIIAHAGISRDLIGRTSGSRLKSFVLYGDTTGETLPDGRPVRRDWAKQYHGEAFIVYGHTPVRDCRFVNNTVNIDTGCVFGGKLTALRYPEKTAVSVPSRQPFQPEKFSEFPD